MSAPPHGAAEVAPGVPAAPGRGARAWRWLRFPVSLSALGWILWRIDLGAALEVALGARPSYLAVAFAFLIVTRWIAAYRWWILLRVVVPGMTFAAVHRLVLVSTFFGYFLPGIGTDVVRVYGASRATADPASVVGTMVLERVLAVVALVVLALAGVYASSLEVPAYFRGAAWATLAAVLAAAAAAVSPPLRRAIERPLAPAVFAPVRGVLGKVWACFDRFADRRGLVAWSLAVSLLFQLVRIAPVASTAWALGVDVGLGDLLVVVPVTILVVQLPISFGGLGVREATYVHFLGRVGVSPEAAFALSIVTYLLNVVSVLHGAWFYARGGVAGGARAPEGAPGEGAGAAARRAGEGR